MEVVGATQLMFLCEPFTQADLLDKGNYKTEICRKWIVKTCHWGEKCIFAHGRSELREKKVVKVNYKTKQCKQFHETGCCVYGDRCQFKHTERGESDEGCTRRRLPVFVGIERKGSN